jgi:hypothetical protein
MDEIIGWGTARVEAKGWSLGNHKKKMVRGIIVL